MNRKQFKLLLTICLLIVTSIGTTVGAYAQIDITKPIEELVYNKSTVVTDGKGKHYDYNTWNKLISSGNYKLKPINEESDSTVFILVKRDEKKEEKLFTNKPAETNFFKNGDPFTFFEMVDMNGTVFKVPDLKGKIVVINFWFIACPPCRYEMPELNRLVNTYKNNKDVVFIAISLDKPNDLKKFLTLSPFNYHVIGNSKFLFEYYGVVECPTSLVIDKQGIIRFNSLGYNNGSISYWLKKTIALL